MISFSSNDDLAVFEYFEVVFVEKCSAVIVAEFSYGDERACLEIV